MIIKYLPPSDDGSSLIAMSGTKSEESATSFAVIIFICLSISDEPWNIAINILNELTYLKSSLFTKIVTSLSI